MKGVVEPVLAMLSLFTLWSSQQKIVSDDAKA